MDEIMQEDDEMLRWEEGNPPQRRAYAYLERHNVVKPYDETAMQTAVKHMVKRAAGGVTLDAEEKTPRLEEIANKLYDIADELMPDEQG